MRVSESIGGKTPRDRLAAWMFVAYGVFVLGFFFFPERSSHYKFYYVAVLVPGLVMAVSVLPALWQQWSFRMLALWLLYQLVSGLWSDPFAAEAYGRLAWWWLQVVIFLLVTAALRQRFPHRFDMLVRVLVAGVALLGVASIVAWYGDHPFPVSRLEPLGRIDNPILAGCAYGVFAVLALHYLLGARSAGARLLYAAALLVTVSVVLLTHSRTAMGGVLAAFAVMLAGHRSRAAAVMMVSLVGLFAVAALAFPEVFDRLGMSPHWRPRIWQSVLERVSEAPLFGHGYLADTHVLVGQRAFQHAHSSYLGFLRDGGVLGLFLFIAAIGVFGRRILQSGATGRRFPFLLPLLAFALVVIAPDIDRLITRPKELWLFFWWPLGLGLGDSQSSRVRDSINSS